MATSTVAPAQAPRAPKRPKAGAKPKAASRKAAADSLNPRQRAFVVEYLKDKNAAQAYRRVYGVSAEAAETSGPRLFRNVQVRSEIDRLDAELLEKATQDAGLTMERLTREVARGAFYDVRKLLDAEGHPIPIHLLDDDTASAISGLEIETRQAKGEDGFATVVRKYKLADRKGFVDMGLKVKGGYKTDNDQQGKGAAEAMAAFIAGLRERGAGNIPVSRKGA